MASRVDPGLAGRADELRRLRGRLLDAASGERQSVLVLGEAGMGKTALCKVLSVDAEKAGFHVSWGRCWEDVDTPPFWPWTQILESAAELSGESEDRAVDAALAQLSATSSPATDAEASAVPAARFALYRTVGSYVRRACGERPQLLILEDLHAADESSLLLLEFVITAVTRGQLMIVGTYAPRDLERRQAVARVMSRIARESEQIVVGPLDADAVRQIATQIVGEAPSDALLSAVVRMTEGNPFFVEEAARLLATDRTLERGDHSVGFRVPEGVRAIVASRIDALPNDTRELLGVASVIGREFVVSLLAEVSELDVDAVLGLLEPALNEGVLEETGALGSYRFVHILGREAVYEGLTSGQRMRLHRRVGEVLETQADLEAQYPALAHHWFKAAQAGDRSKTIDYSRAAARAAMARQAFEEAARLYRRALSAAELMGADTETRNRLRDQLREAEAAGGGASTPTADSGPGVATFHRRGGICTITYEGETVRLKDTRGLAYLSVLLRSPHEEIHSLDIAALRAGEGRGSTSSRDDELSSDAFSDSGPVLDDTAKRRYKQRLQDLNEELSEAEAFNDTERAARARSEMDALTHELASAVGLRGRDRRLGAPAERARTAVTKTLKDAIGKIQEAHPELGLHLRSTVRTGMFCSYTPDPRSAIRWDVDGDAE